MLLNAIMAALLTAELALCFWNSCLIKVFVVDEFMYAHGAWQWSRGDAPYRDFVFHTAWLGYLFYSIPFRFLDANPLNILYLREVSFGLGLLTIGGVWLLTSRSRWGAAGSIVLLLTPVFFMRAAEIRRDNLAIPLLLAAVIVAGNKNWSPRIRGAIIGLLYVLLGWANEKAWTFALPLPLAAVITLFPYAGRPRLLVGSGWTFLAAAAASTAVLLLAIFAGGTLGDWFEWHIKFTMLHERLYPGFSISGIFGEYLADLWWMVLLAVPGITATVKSLREDEISNQDLLLLLLLPCTFASFAALSGPYVYSLLPFNTILSIFAGRGLLQIGRWIRSAERNPGGLSLENRCGALTAILFIVPLCNHELNRNNRLFRQTNSGQLEVLSLVNRLTDPEDVVFELSGSSVTRFNTSRFFFSDASLRFRLDQGLWPEIKAGFYERGCVMYMHDLRFPVIPPDLQRYLHENFVPYSGDLGIWGRKYKKGRLEAAADFVAPVPGKYFIFPRTALDSGELRIGGNVIKQEIFELEKGQHRIEYSGGEPEFSIIWLPRDGKTFKPLDKFNPRFSVIL